MKFSFIIFASLKSHTRNIFTRLWCGCRRISSISHGLNKYLCSLMIVFYCLCSRSDVSPDTSAILQELGSLFTLIEEVGSIVDDFYSSFSANTISSSTYWTNLGNRIISIHENSDEILSRLTSLFYDVADMKAYAEAVTMNSYLTMQDVNTILSSMSDVSSILSAFQDCLSRLQSMESSMSSYYEVTLQADEELQDTVEEILSVLHDIIITLDVGDSVAAIRTDVFQIREYLYLWLSSIQADARYIAHGLGDVLFGAYTDIWSCNYPFLLGTGNGSIPSSFPLSTSVAVIGGGSGASILSACGDALRGILLGNESMNKNLLFICDAVYAIASNMLDNVDFHEKQTQWYNEFSERQQALETQLTGIENQYRNKFTENSFTSVQVNDIFETTRSHINDTFSPYIVDELPTHPPLRIFGLSGFSGSFDSVQGSMNVTAFGSFFTAARFCFGFLYWSIMCLVVFWCFRKCLSLYRFTLRMFSTLPQQVT